MMRDKQLDEPACYCDLCGGECYIGDMMFVSHKGRICRDCAISEEIEMTWDNLFFAGEGSE